MQECVRTLQDGLWFVVAVCVVLKKSSWRAAGSSVRLRSDLEMFVLGCRIRSLPECLHLYRPVQVKNRRSPSQEKHIQLLFFCYVQSLFFYYHETGKLLWSVPIVSEKIFLWRAESSFGNWKERLRGQIKPTIIVCFIKRYNSLAGINVTCCFTECKMKIEYVFSDNPQIPQLSTKMFTKHGHKEQYFFNHILYLF